MQYVIRFTGKVSWEGQANGLPEEIYAFLIFDSEGKEGESATINHLIETQAAAFVRSQAMLVQRDQGKTVDIRQTPADRMLVPMRWIVNILVDVHNIIGELSQADEQGTEKLKDGKEPVKQ